MKHGIFVTLVVAVIGMSLGSVALAPARPSLQSSPQKEAAKPLRAKGTFDVSLLPQGPDDTTPGATLGRMTINKKLHGDLEGTSKGQMLTATTAVEGSAGYVAMEKVSGTLHGRNGTFALQHIGTRTRGHPYMLVEVVPDSGTGELAGISGKMKIDVADGKHSYDFEYTLAGAR